MESEGGRCEEAPGQERPPSLLLLGLSLRRRRRSSTTFSSLTLTAFVTLLLLLETLLLSETEALEVEAVLFSEGEEEEIGTASASLASSTEQIFPSHHHLWDHLTILLSFVPYTTAQASGILRLHSIRRIREGDDDEGHIICI